MDILKYTIIGGIVGGIVGAIAWLIQKSTNKK